MLPSFDPCGNLPPGVHWATWEEMVLRFGSSSRRIWLIKGLYRALKELRRAGCSVIYLDGSFVTAKENPDDYDACFELVGLDLKVLQKLSPVFFDFTNSRAAQKAKYRGEWFPAEMAEGLTGRTFIQFFQIDKDTGESKGIIAIDLRSLV